MIELRGYQREALDKLWAYWDDNDGSPLVVAPTGSGKSVLIAAFIREARARFPDTKFLVVTHVRELIRQNFRAMLAAWPTAPAGIYSAGLKQRSTNNPITFCGIQSVHKKASAFGFVDLLLIDEAHLLSRRTDSMYGRFIAALQETNPALKVVGFTATPYRLDSGRLDEGKGALFDGVACDIDILELVDQGFLAPLVSKATKLRLDTSSVHRRGGEFIEAELQAAVDRTTVTEAACREIVSYGQDRRSWLAFCAGVEHARHVSEMLCSHGVRADYVHGEMPGPERDRILGAFLSGELQCVSNANILTTGFDHPPLDMIAMLRPTLSTGLYVQMLGRGMRLAEGKTNCLVLDFARNIERHGPVNAVRIHKPGEGNGEMPVKTCPECQSIVPTGTLICPDCGYVWPMRDPDKALVRTASTAEVLSRDLGPQWLTVSSWYLWQNAGRNGKRDTVRVDYRCGLQTHREWLCFDHPVGSYPRGKATQWWMRHSRLDAGNFPPVDVAEAVRRQGELRCPAQIMVRKKDQYFEIVNRSFAALQDMGRAVA